MRSILFVAVLGMILSVGQSAQAAMVVATFNGYDGSAVGNSGRFNWTQSSASATANPWLPMSFKAFCIETAQNISGGGTYTYVTKNLRDSPLPDSTSPIGMGLVKENLIKRLWFNEYSDLNTDTGIYSKEEKRSAFQIAIWKIIGYSSVSGYGNVDSQALANIYITNAGTSGGMANLVALTSLTNQDQVVELNDGWVPGGDGGITQATPVPAAIVLALFGGASFLGLRRFLVSQAAAVAQA